MRRPWIYSYLEMSETLAPKCQGPLTQNHLKTKVTVRQFSGYRKIKSIYAETMLLFLSCGGMATMWNGYGRRRYAFVRIGNQNYLQWP